MVNAIIEIQRSCLKDAKNHTRLLNDFIIRTGDLICCSFYSYSYKQDY